MLTPERFRRILTHEERSVSAFLWRQVLTCVDPFYALGVTLRNRGYDRHPQYAFNVGVPVISVGNLTLGGTGKSPIIRYIVREIQQQGRSVAVLSRGYHAEKQHPKSAMIAPVETDACGMLLNDEGREMARTLPGVLLFQNPKRTESATRAVKYGAQVLLLDDGFQHRKLFRNGDIVLIDATEPFGLTGRLFPLGTLREPMCGLRRANVLILTHAEHLSVRERCVLREELAERFPLKKDVVWVETTHAPVGFFRWLQDENATEQIPQETLKKMRVGAFCGIGKPSGFFATLRRCGIEPVTEKIFSDHYAYDITDIEELSGWARENQLSALICTEKDGVKLPTSLPDGTPIYTLKIEIAFLDGENEFRNWLLQMIKS